MSDPKHRIQRILALIPYVRKHQGVALEDLARYLGASPAEIMADLDRVLLCGVPPYLPDDYIGVYVEDGRVEIRFAEHFRRPIRFTLTEALALKLAIESLPPGGDPVYAEARRSLLDRIHAILGRSGGLLARTTREEAAAARLATQAGKGPAFGVPPWRTRIKEVLEVLVPAVEQRREVEIEYYSASSDATAPRVVQPLGFVDKGGEYYLVAYCKRSEEVRSFRVDRLRAARALEQRFRPPAGFDLARYERRAMDFTRDVRYRARVRVRGEQVRWIREQVPAPLREEAPDGSLIVTIPAKSLTWLLNEILRYGPGAEVLEPAEVREALHAHLSAMRARVAADAQLEA
ncbi:MAG: hypothetical protein KatS3mg102_1733 [Planctomycetota bacterium]|nr:MAG: hypothetical protein KatS3mg102_1733 [Planctomycetota bacterium]